MKRRSFLWLLILVVCMAVFAASAFATDTEAAETAEAVDGTTPTVISTGTQYHPTDTETVQFTWELDSEGTLTFYKGSSSILQTASQDTNIYRAVEYWRKETTEGYSVTNENLVKKIVVSDGFTYIRNQHNAPLVIFGSWPKLTTIIIPSSVYFVNNYTNEGFFSSNPELTTISHSGTSENNREGVVNLEKITRVDGGNGSYPNFERMFYNCPSITEVILPSKNTSSTSTNATYQMFYGCTSLKQVNFPAWMTSIGTGMFYNCTSLETLTFPSTVGTIAANALTGCTSLKSITFENPGLAIPEGMVIPDNEGLVINCASIAQATAINALGLANATVKLDLSGNFLTDGTGYAYTLKDGVLTVEKAETTATTVLSTDIEHGLAGVANTVIITEESGVTAIAADFFDGFIASTVVVPSTLTDLSAAGIFANMANLTTIVDYTAYSADNTAGAGIINLLGVTAASDDTFSGSSATLAPVVYIGKSTALPGTAFDWFASDAAVTYYVYPTSSAATYFRANDIAFSYLTVEQTGDENLVRSGTAINTNSGNNAFDWSFDEATGVLTYSKNAAGSGEFTWRNYTMNEIKPWKQTWRDAVKRIVVTGFTSRKLQRNYGGYESPFSNFANLESVHLACYTSQMYITFYANNKNGWFENCPKLTTVSYGSDDTIDNVIDLSNWYEYTNGWYEMFKGCTSITKIIFPASLKNSTSNSNYPPAVFSGMFDGCTSLTSITLPSYFTNIEANGFANCSNLKEVIITNPDMTIADATAFPDIAGLTVVCASQTQYDAITAFGYENVNVVLDITGNLLADGTGFIYALRETAESSEAKRLYNLVVTKASATVGTALAIDNLSEDYLASIVAVIIDETSGITELSASVFEGMEALETVIIPSTLTTVGAKSFASLPALETVALYNDYYEAGFDAEGIIDLRTVTTLAADTFEESFASVTPTLYLAKTASISGDINWVSADSASVTIYTYPSGAVASAVRNSDAENIIHKYYTYEMTGDSTLLREDAAISSDTGGVQFRWSFDDATGKLTVTPSAGAETSNSSNLSMNAYTTVWQSWKTTWSDAVEKIYVVNFGGGQIYAQHQNCLFSNLPNLNQVHFSKALSRISISTYGTNGLFQNCPSLTTVSYGADDTYDEVIDLSFWKKQDYNNPGMFYGCKSIKKVIMPSELTKQSSSNADIIIANNMFRGCTALEEIVITQGFGGIGSNSFEGCTALKKIVIENQNFSLTSAAFPTHEGLVIHATSDSVTSALTSFGYTAKNMLDALTAEGFSIRYTDYNGLRGAFSFDEKKNAEIEALGYELLEYGVVVTSASEYAAWGGVDIKLRNGAYVSEATSIKKLPVYQNGAYVGKVLSTTVQGERVDFAASIVKFNANHKRDVYIASYVIYTDAAGYDYVLYENYSTSEGQIFFNLYDMTLSMYANADKSGILDAGVDEKAVWNTLLQGADSSFKETALEGYAGVTSTLVRLTSDSEEYIHFIRSEDGTAVTDEMIAAAEALIPADTFAVSETLAVAIADQGTTAPEYSEAIDYVTVTTPNRYPRYATPDADQKYGAQHLQGMTVDDEGNVYFSLTTMIVKVNQAGEEVGVYKAAAEWISNLSMHIGNIVWHDGNLYIGLGISKTAVSGGKRYVGVLDDSVFDAEGGFFQDSDASPVMKAVCIEAISYNKTFTDADGTARSKFGGGGIDGITVGHLPGKGYILPAGATLKEDVTGSDGKLYTAGTVLTEDLEVTDDELYLFGVRTIGSYDTYRFDDDNQQIMVFDFDDFVDGENLTPMTYARVASEYDADIIGIKYNMFVYTGYHDYGCQVISYDKSTGDILMWPYDRASNCNEFPDDNFNVVDGSKKLYLDVVEVGQSVPETSEYYAIASDYASNYVDENDMDGDGDVTEQLLGWHMTLKCVCSKLDIENHSEVIYGDTGHAVKYCGSRPGLAGDNGCISLGNDYFYVASQSNTTMYREDGTTTQTAYGGRANLYRISRYHGAWSFVKVS